MTLAKYWLKMKVVMTVKKGWLAQSKRAQLYWPSLEASLGGAFICRCVIQAPPSHIVVLRRQDADHESGTSPPKSLPRQHKWHHRPSDLRAEPMSCATETRADGAG